MAEHSGEKDPNLDAIEACERCDERHDSPLCDDEIAQEHPAIECAFHGEPMTLARTVETWGLGRCCLGCGMPVSVRIEHPGPTKAVVTGREGLS